MYEWNLEIIGISASIILLVDLYYEFYIHKEPYKDKLNITKDSIIELK